MQIKYIWGKEDKETINLLKRINITGTWLNLAAGDGRYNNILLEKANKVVALDIDKKALKILQKNTPKELHNKLKVKVADATKKLAFDDESLDGVLCTGGLHMCSKNLLEKTFNEIYRILKPNGNFIFDFATDIKRVLLDGTPMQFLKDEPKYNLKQARELLNKLLKRYGFRIIKKIESEVPKELLSFENKNYHFSCKFLLISARK